MSKQSPLPTSLSTMPLHMPNRDFIVATVPLVTVSFNLHVSVLSCFILNETYDMLQQQETLYLRYINSGSHVSFQIVKSNHTCANFFQAWTNCIFVCSILFDYFATHSIIYVRLLSGSNVIYFVV